MHPILGVLRHLPYNLILNRILSGRWGSPSGALPSDPISVTEDAANPEICAFVVKIDSILDPISKCPELYSDDVVNLSQLIDLFLL